MAEDTRPVGGTVQVNPSNAAEDPQPVAWVQGQGYDQAPDRSRSSEEVNGDFSDIYERAREGAVQRRQEKEEIRERNRGRSGDGGVA